MSTLGEAPLKTSKEATDSFPASKLWADGPVLIVVLRRPGCCEWNGPGGRRQGGGGFLAAFLPPLRPRPSPPDPTLMVLRAAPALWGGREGLPLALHHAPLPLLWAGWYESTPCSPSTHPPRHAARRPPTCLPACLHACMHACSVVPRGEHQGMECKGQIREGRGQAGARGAPLKPATTVCLPLCIKRKARH